MKLNLIPTKEITELEKEIDHELEVRERPPHSDCKRYYVSFKGGESSEGSVLVGYSGNGDTIDEALQDYCKQVSCRKMIFNAFKSERKEILFPKLTNCLGLAAPQINYSVRMFIMKFDNGLPEIVINPTITKERGKQTFKEGCMSIPKVYANVECSSIVDVMYYDEEFKVVKKRLRGLEAIIFQHEYEHLDGKLFIDRITKEQLLKIKDKLDEITSGVTDATYDMIFPGTDVVQVKKVVQ